MRKRFEKGSATALLGVFVLLFAFVIAIYILQFFSLSQQASITQNNADTVADGVAVYMAENGGNVNTAENRADEIFNIIKDNQALKLNGLTKDISDFSNRIFGASVESEEKALGYVINGDLQISREAATRYTRFFFPKHVLEAFSDIDNKYVMFSIRNPENAARADADAMAKYICRLLNTAGYTSMEPQNANIDNISSILIEPYFEQKYAFYHTSDARTLHPGDIIIVNNGTDMAVGICSVEDSVITVVFNDYLLEGMVDIATYRVYANSSWTTRDLMFEGGEVYAFKGEE